LDWKSQRKPLIWIVAVFCACFWLPIGIARFDGAVMEALQLVRWYAREHVLLCLVPAFFIAGAIAVFVSQASVMKYLGARANKILAYGVASVSGGILAVSKGQTEAGLAMGLRRSQLLRFIILPQAFRIILPPLGNQYLNLAKNTSLGVAVAFPEVVAVGQTVFNQRGVSVQIILFWMAFYLTVSLTISAVVNYFNRRLQLVER